MVIFLKRRRRIEQSLSQHLTINKNGRIFVGGIYAGFLDDSFKVVHPSPPFDKETIVTRQVCAQNKTL